MIPAAQVTTRIYKEQLFMFPVQPIKHPFKQIVLPLSRLMTCVWPLKLHTLLDFLSSPEHNWAVLVRSALPFMQQWQAGEAVLQANKSHQLVCQAHLLCSWSWATMHWQWLTLSPLWPPGQLGGESRGCCIMQAAQIAGITMLMILHRLKTDGRGWTGLGYCVWFETC